MEQASTESTIWQVTSDITPPNGNDSLVVTTSVVYSEGYFVVKTISGPNTTYQNGSITASAGMWHHLYVGVAAKDGDLELWVDGKLDVIVNSTVVVDSLDLGCQFQLGCADEEPSPAPPQSSPPGCFNGLLEELKVYSQILDDCERKQAMWGQPFALDVCPGKVEKFHDEELLVHLDFNSYNELSTAPVDISGNGFIVSVYSSSDSDTTTVEYEFTSTFMDEIV